MKKLSGLRKVAGVLSLLILAATDATQLIASGLAPTNPLESGMAIASSPGAYTALLAEEGDSRGVGIVEVYDRGTP